MTAPPVVTSPYFGAVSRNLQEPDESSWTSLDDLYNGVKELIKANKEYVKAFQYYEGKRAEVFASERFRQALYRTGVTYRMNFAKTPVDSVVDRLDLSAITGIDDATTALINQIFDENDMDVEEPEIHRRACEFGDAYVLVWPTDDIDEDSEDDSPTETLAEDADEPPTGVDMYYNDPRTMRLFYDDENPRIKSYGLKMWDKGDHSRANLYYLDRIEKWRTAKGKMGSKAERNEWHFIGQVDNPYGKIPIFHFRTDRPYGCPLHKDAYGPQDIISKLVITHMTTVDYHGFPQRYAISGGDMADGDEETEEFGFGETPQAPPNNDIERNRSSLRSEPGHMWFLKNVKSVGQFQAALPATFLQPLEAYVSMMGQLTTTPLHHFDWKGNPPSGEALRVSEARFIKKILRLQKLFGATWRDLSEFALLVAGHLGPLGRIKTTWANPAASNDQLAWDLALMKRDVGVPIRQILLDADYSPKQLDEWGVPDSKYEAPPPPKPIENTPGVHINPVSRTGILA